jgi:formylglycine-generating enzyme required for sulfatase activity
MSYVDWTHPYWENLSPEQFDAAERRNVPALAKSSEHPGFYWVVIPEGRFLAGCPPWSDCSSVSSQDQHEEVISSSFYLMTTEATVAQYFSFCKETDCRRLRRPAWNKSDHAVIGLKKRDAADFCGWLGGRLPTHEEWERASRGGRDDFLYPWGNEFDEDFVNGGDLKNNVKRPGRVAGMDRWPRTSPPGSFSPNGFGLFDMSGNAQEWVNNGDWSYQVRDLRGGSWAAQPSVLMIHTRMFDLSDVVDFDSEALWAISGVRCAKDIP